MSARATLLNRVPCLSSQCQGAERHFRLSAGVIACSVCFAALPEEQLYAPLNDLQQGAMAAGGSHTPTGEGSNPSPASTSPSAPGPHAADPDPAAGRPPAPKAISSCGAAIPLGDLSGSPRSQGPILGDSFGSLVGGKVWPCR